MPRGQQQQQREDTGGQPSLHASKEGNSFPLSALVKQDADLYRLLAAAVRYDASLCDESILKNPLEEGRIYYTNSRRRGAGGTPHRPAIQGPQHKPPREDEFSRAIQTIRNHETTKAKAPFSLLKRKPRRQYSSNQDKPKAITPAVLSRLCSYVNTASLRVSAPELVLYTEALRSRAWLQMRRRERRRRFLKYVVVPVLLVSSLVSVLRQKVVHADEVIRRVRYRTGACDSLDRPQACHFADAAVFPLLAFANYYTHPASMAVHLKLRNETLSWDEVVGNHKNHKPTRDPYDNNPLDETVVNQLVRQSIMTHSENLKHSQDENVLDLGCGLGSTLYSLVPLLQQRKTSSSTRRHAKSPKLQYTGVALGSLEVENAERLVEQHFPNRNQVNATFAWRDFATTDFNLPTKTYSVVVAIESLSYAGEALPKVLQTIHKSLQKDGILIVVEDVVLHKNPMDADIRARKQTNPVRLQLFRQAFLRPALLQHQEWRRTFQAAGFSVLESRDLTLEYELLPDAEDPALFFRGARSNNLWSHFYFTACRFLLDQYRRLMVEILMHWLKVVPSDVESISSWLQMLLLRTGGAASNRGYALRKQAYWDAELSYNLYVLKR